MALNLNCEKVKICNENRSNFEDDTSSTTSSSASTPLFASTMITVRPCGSGYVYSCDRTKSLNFLRQYSRKLGAAAFANNSIKYNPRMARKHMQKDRTPREQRLRDKNTVDARVSRQKKIRNTDAMLYCEKEEEKDHEKMLKLKAAMQVYLKKLNQELLDEDDSFFDDDIIEEEIMV